MKISAMTTMVIALACAWHNAARADLVPTTGLDYNVIDFGDYTQSAVDVTGRLAVGGDLTVANFAVGMALTGAPGGASLVVGGNLAWASGTVYGGDTQVGGTASVTNFGEDAGTRFVYASAGANPPPAWLNPVAAPNGGIAAGFFSGALSYANALSATLGGLADNGQTSFDADGHIRLTATSAGTNVFSLTAAQVAAASWHGIDITAAAGATVIVNIDGNGGVVAADDLPFTLNGGIAPGDVVSNFVNTTVFSATNIGWLGSVLAPGALYQGGLGNIDGDVVVAGVLGTTEFHDMPFVGSLPLVQPATATLNVALTSGTPVPEPGSVALLLGGLVFLRLAHRRRQARAAV